MQLLLVEDSPTDRMVIQARLQRAFPRAQIMTASDTIAMNEHLRRDGFDVVITDYWLGWSDGLSILQQVRERWPQSRVIMLTGNGGEEVVADAFKHGLYHYLLKPDGFGELADVTRAAMESKRREDRNELMALIVNSLPDAVHSVDVAGRISAINNAARETYGYANLEIVGLTNEILLPAEHRDEIRRMRQRALGGEIVPRFTTMLVRSDGVEIPVSITILPMRHGDGLISSVAFIANVLDMQFRHGASRVCVTNRIRRATAPR